MMAGPGNCGITFVRQRMARVFSPTLLAASASSWNDRRRPSAGRTSKIASKASGLPRWLAAHARARGPQTFLSSKDNSAALLSGTCGDISRRAAKKAIPRCVIYNPFVIPCLTAGKLFASRHEVGRERNVDRPRLAPSGSHSRINVLRPVDVAISLAGRLRARAI